MTLARFSPPALPLSGHVPRRRRFAPVRQLLKFLRIFPVISYIFINVLSYKNLYPIPLRILYLHIMFVFDIFAFNIFAFDIFPFDIFPFDIFPFNIFPFDIFPFDIFPFDIFPFDIFTIQIHFYNIPKNPQMCPAHRDLPNPSPLTLGSTFRSQHRRIQTQVNKTPVLHNQALLKKARGVCRGAAALRPLCGFPFFLKKILHAIRQKSKRHTVFKKKYF